MRSHGKRKNWVVLYREAGVRKYYTVGAFKDEQKPGPGETGRVHEGSERAGCPCSRSKRHIRGFPRRRGAAVLPLEVEALHGVLYREPNPSSAAGRVRSREADGANPEAPPGVPVVESCGLFTETVAHLRWDLRGIFKLAVAEGFTERDPTSALFTPKEAKVAETRVMNRKEAQQHINALDLRERVIDHLALFVGMRPG